MFHGIHRRSVRIHRMRHGAMIIGFAASRDNAKDRSIDATVALESVLMQ